MGNRSQKKTNEMLGQQTAAANQFAGNMGGYGAQEYAQRTGLRDQLTNEYWNLYRGTSAYGGGGGGGGAGYDVRMNEAMPTARELMNTGLWSPEQIAESKSWATAPITGIYEGLRNQMLRTGAGMGLPGAYSGAINRAAQDAAYRANQYAGQADMAIQKDIRDRRTQGIGLVGGFDTEFMNRQAQAAAAARAAANAGNAQQMAYLSHLEGLMGNDLPYWDRQLAGLGAATGSVAARVDETPAWQRAAMSIIPAATSAAVGAFWNPSSRRTPNFVDYTPSPSADEYAYMYGRR